MPNLPPEEHPEPSPTRDRLARMAKYWPEIVSPESDIMLALSRLNSVVRAGTDGILKRHRLSPAAFDVLVTLRSLPDAGAITPTDICRASKISSGGLTKVLHRLKARRLIRVGVSQRDGRQKNLTLSVQGRTLVERAATEVAALERNVFAGKMGRVRLHHLRDTLMDILTDVEQGAPSPDLAVQNTASYS